MLRQFLETRCGYPSDTLRLTSKYPTRTYKNAARIPENLSGYRNMEEKLQKYTWGGGGEINIFQLHLACSADTLQTRCGYHPPPALENREGKAHVCIVMHSAGPQCQNARALIISNIFLEQFRREWQSLLPSCLQSFLGGLSL